MLLPLLFLFSVAFQSASVQPPAGWVSAPLQQLQYASYIRQERDGTQSAIVARKHVCSCEPHELASQLQSAVSQLPNVNVSRNSVTVCAEPSEHVTVTGIADGTHANFEIYAFRKNNALYVLQYTFHSVAPQADAESALLSLCPP